MIKDLREFIFDVGDVVIGKYSKDVREIRDVFRKPQRIKTKEEIEEVVPGTRPYKVLFQLVQFEDIASTFEGNLFLPYDDTTKDLVNIRDLGREYPYNKVARKTKVKQQITRLPALSNGLYFKVSKLIVTKDEVVSMLRPLVKNPEKFKFLNCYTILFYNTIDNVVEVFKHVDHKVIVLQGYINSKMFMVMLILYEGQFLPWFATKELDVVKFIYYDKLYGGLNILVKLSTDDANMIFNYIIETKIK